jgi:hypothetical protein
MFSTFLTTIKWRMTSLWLQHINQNCNISPEFSVSYGVTRAESGWNKMYFCFIHSTEKFQREVYSVPHWNSTSFTQDIDSACGNYLLSHAFLTPSTNDYFFWCKYQSSIKWYIYFPRTKVRKRKLQQHVGKAKN